MSVRFAGVAAAILAVAGCGESAGDVLPDLVEASPGAISVVREDGRDRLVFLSAAENVGPGALVVLGTRTGPGHRMRVRQLVERSDGTSRSVEIPGAIRFVASETHRHWHLLGFERYELRTVGGRQVGRGRKGGFCLGDRYDIHGSKTLPNEPAGPVYVEECGRGRPGLRSIREGISPGYGDDYVPRLEGQYVDVTDVPPGRYRLVHEVNPDRTLRELRYDNNTASVVLRLHRNPDGSVGVEVEH